MFSCGSEGNYLSLANMTSLVGYGLSSESDSDGDVEVANIASVGPAANMYDKASSAKMTRNFLLEPESDSSEGGDASDPQEEPFSSLRHPPIQASQTTLGSLTPNKLPPPLLNTCSDSSVFANPFKAQADKTLSALQIHVPLTMQAKPSQIGGKRMCVSYRKYGKCRFGIKCKFAHDSDVQTTVVPADCHATSCKQTPVSDQAELPSGSQNPKQETKTEETGGRVKKRRAGLGNSLVPPKRAMKQYYMQKNREQISMP